MTVAEAAKKLRVSLALVYAMVADGRLPCVRLGRKGRRGCIRIKEADVNRLMG